MVVKRVIWQRVVTQEKKKDPPMYSRFFRENFTVWSLRKLVSKPGVSSWRAEWNPLVMSSLQQVTSLSTNSKLSSKRDRQCSNRIFDQQCFVRVWWDAPHSVWLLYSLCVMDAGIKNISESQTLVQTGKRCHPADFWQIMTDHLEQNRVY